MTNPKIEAVERMYAAFGQGDVGAILAEVADDVDWVAGTEAGSAPVPWFGRYRGKADLPRFFKEIGTNIAVSEFTPLAFASGDDDVMAAVRWTYKVLATGRTTSAHMQHWFHFVDGQVAMVRTLEDNLASSPAFAPTSDTAATGSAADVLRSYAEAFSSGDLDALVDHYAEATDYRQPFAPDGLQDRAAIHAFESAMFASFDDVDLSIEWLVADGDEAAAGALIRATHTGDLSVPDGSVLPATGRRIALHSTEHIQVDGGGKIVEHRRYMDGADFFRQLTG